jgi:hypothetical protein
MSAGFRLERIADSIHSHGIKGLAEAKYNATTAPLQLVPQLDFISFYKAHGLPRKKQKYILRLMKNRFG